MAIYYVSAVASGNGSGSSETNSMNLETAMGITYANNDRIRFKRGDVFYSKYNKNDGGGGSFFNNSVVFNSNISDGNWLYIENYGDPNAPLPRLSGAKIAGNSWQAYSTPYNTNIWRIDLSVNSNFTGNSPVNEFPSHLGYYRTRNIGFLEDSTGKIFGNRVIVLTDLGGGSWGLNFGGTIAALTQELDFHCDNNQWLYVKCDSNPYTKYGNLLMCTDGRGLFVRSNYHVEGLRITHMGGSGIHNIGTDNSSVASDQIRNVRIKGCIFENLGGCTHGGPVGTSGNVEFIRYGNGVDFYLYQGDSYAHDVTIEKCIFRRIYDGGTGFEAHPDCNNASHYNMVIKDNIFIECGFTDYGAVTQYNNPSQTSRFEAEYYNNLHVNSGRGWGFNTRPDQWDSALMASYGIIRAIRDVDIHNNYIFNPRRLYFNWGDILSQSWFKSDYNTMYLDTDIHLVIRNQWQGGPLGWGPGDIQTNPNPPIAGGGDIVGISNFSVMQSRFNIDLNSKVKPLSAFANWSEAEVIAQTSYDYLEIRKAFIDDINISPIHGFLVIENFYQGLTVQGNFNGELYWEEVSGGGTVIVIQKSGALTNYGILQSGVDYSLIAANISTLTWEFEITSSIKGKLTRSATGANLLSPSNDAHFDITYGNPFGGYYIDFQVKTNQDAIVGWDSGVFGSMSDIKMTITIP